MLSRKRNVPQKTTRLTLAALLTVMVLITASGCSSVPAAKTANPASPYAFSWPKAGEAWPGAEDDRRYFKRASETEVSQQELEDELEDELDEDLEEEEPTVADPLEGFNRVMFQINDKLYTWVMRPLAKGYRAVVPELVRTGVKNFFINLATPIRLVNCLLQGKGRAAEAEFARFLTNTTIGVLGFGNPAKDYPELNPPSEDTGQTLGRWGIGEGFYLVLPIIGPSTLRDTVGLFGDYYLNPLSYVTPPRDEWTLKAYRDFNRISFHIGDYEALKEASLDPYLSVRNGYIQLRRSRLKK